MPSTPLLLLPGLMNDERLWDPIKQAVTDRVVKIAPTHGADSMKALAAAVLAQAPAGRFAIAGFSLGGYVTLELCRQAPGRVAGVALIDTSARADTAEARQNRQRLLDALKSRTSSFDEVIAQFPARLLHPDRVADPHLVGLLSSMGRAVGVEAFVQQQTAAMNREDRSDVLKTLDVPALVLCGEQDTTTPPERSREIAALLAGDVDLVIVPAAGHLTPLEQPDAVVPPFLRWLAKVDAGEPR